MAHPGDRQITAVRHIPDGLHVKVVVDLDDGRTTSLFRYYPDELSITEKELIGLSVNEAYQLFHKKDMEYLRS